MNNLFWQKAFYLRDPSKIRWVGKNHILKKLVTYIMSQPCGLDRHYQGYYVEGMPWDKAGQAHVSMSESMGVREFVLQGPNKNLFL